MHVVDRDFSGKYKDILKEEFQNLLSSKEEISIRDTAIFKDGEMQDYLVIEGRTYDSISGLSAEQRVLARDVRKLKDLFGNESTNVDTILSISRFNWIKELCNRCFESTICQ